MKIYFVIYLHIYIIYICIFIYCRASPGIIEEFQNLLLSPKQTIIQQLIKSFYTLRLDSTVESSPSQNNNNNNQLTVDFDHDIDPGI